jgi:RNA polymerase sigma factor (sigma-70 family)
MMPQTDATEITAEIIRRAAAGDADAHAAIFRVYQRPVYTLIRRLIARAAVADDLFQEVFVEILRSIGDYTGQGAFGGWVRSIAVSKCLMYLRSPWHRSLRWLDADAEGELAEIPDRGPTPEGETTLRADLERAMATLPALTRSVVWLHDVEGYTHGEIARLMGRTTSFSKSQLARAHMRLRELLDPTQESVVCTPVSTNC